VTPALLYVHDPTAALRRFGAIEAGRVEVRNKPQEQAEGLESRDSERLELARDKPRANREWSRLSRADAVGFRGLQSCLHGPAQPSDNSSHASQLSDVAAAAAGVGVGSLGDERVLIETDPRRAVLKCKAHRCSHGLQRMRVGIWEELSYTEEKYCRLTHAFLPRPPAERR
jgi:hypothetical protein